MCKHHVGRGGLTSRQLAKKIVGGPIFPVRRGPRKGQARRKRGVSYAKALRRDLQKAGLTRRELFKPTPVSLPVDFHSFRRAFGTRAAEELPERHAMHIGGWTTSQAFGRYVVASPRLERIPASILPSLRSATNMAILGAVGPKTWSGTRDSNSRPSAWEAEGFGENANTNDSLSVVKYGHLEPSPDSEAETLLLAGQSLLAGGLVWDAMERALLVGDGEEES